MIKLAPPPVVVHDRRFCRTRYLSIQTGVSVSYVGSRLDDLVSLNTLLKLEIIKDDLDVVIATNDTEVAMPV